ncbi:molybdate ABC transporter substrate-binding protein [Planomicrobium chinense]|uniref:molybdate ABC transporter substrate-binding protein n=1 Tax=Planococcus chinensis TaxID=272917 RepID=UPI001CC6F7C0|nr:molybdate ABC transporter substrate-binding protein [Planococcus chinensis]MBZ5201831.1 molybdate ABC transporter substrate-binding protein [Planococcus chinensis]
MRKIIPLLAAVSLLSACGGTSADSDGELLISSASSLTEVMLSAEKEFNKTHPEVDVAFNFGSSSKLRNQIEQGAPVDLFLSASANDMDILQQGGLVQEQTIRNFAENRLVLASVDRLEKTDPEQLLKDSSGIVAVGEPESVPIGFYTKEALSSMGIWDALAGKLILAKDARQVLSYIESGNAEMGIVYSSDAARSPNLQTAIDLPQGKLEIVYPAAITSEAKNIEAAEAFLAFLTSEEGQKLLEEYGFVPVEGAQPDA